MMTDWPDTRDDPIPEYSGPDWAVRWLMGRHPMLAGLVKRLPGVIERDENGPWVDLDALKETIRAYEMYLAEWEAYQKRHRSRDGGPEPPTRAVAAIGQMSGSEQGRLRLLGTIGLGRVPFSITDLGSFDDAGQQLIRDWVTLIQRR